MKLNFVVNGEEILLSVPSRTHIRTTVQKALLKSANLSKALDDWELRFESGQRIVDLRTPVSTLGENPGPLYLTLNIGAGGESHGSCNKRARAMSDNFRILYSCTQLLP